MIGQLSNRNFLTSMAFQESSNQGENQAIKNGLWNSCQGSLQSVDQCGSPQQSYNWGNTPVVGQMMPQQYQPSGGRYRHLFTALFSLTMAGTCLSFLLWILSLPVMLCCGKRFHRLPGASMSTLTLLNFLCTMGAFIIGLVLAISFNKALTGGWSGKVGNSIWTLLGAMGALLVGFMCFNGTCCGPPRNRNRVTDPETAGGGGMFGKKNRFSKTAAPGPEPAAPPPQQQPPPMSGPSTGMSTARPFQMPQTGQYN
ncbi:hypothetical protein BDB00DRAFT_761271 [Zychaea mexicana]|uniref:uncharacterized protein n=1 Tax=Zychaea mexicana TaxID=64656 RepID=UPI0022FDFA36|nr:uncharacterized protein BDB00DRAFT_761271 [Zychaea mexicana]KAI9494812.1 hypothetical protein BDB00DRAFT_761271 [Zychaea mexicana]